jgi:hypothetical protein
MLIHFSQLEGLVQFAHRQHGTQAGNFQGLECVFIVALFRKNEQKAILERGLM